MALAHQDSSRISQFEIGDNPNIQNDTIEFTVPPTDLQGRDAYKQQISSFRRDHRERFSPIARYLSEDSRIDHPSSKWINRGHVDRREPSPFADVDREVEAVPLRRFRECAQRCRVNGAVDQFKQHLVLKAVDHAENPLSSPRENSGSRAILCREPLREQPLGSFTRFVVPAEHPASQKSQSDQCSRCQGETFGGVLSLHAPAKFLECDTLM